MHSHPDRETFYVITGHPDAFSSDHWKTLGPGDVIDARDGIKHAWRNSSETAASMLCVTTMRMARFPRDVAVDVGSADSSAAAQRFLRLERFTSVAH
jgi:quercetin dioxygenase-like cupin family protein